MLATRHGRPSPLRLRLCRWCASLRLLDAPVLMRVRQAGIRCRGAGIACFHLAVAVGRLHETVVIVKTGQYGSVARPRRAMSPRVVSALVVERAWWCGHQRASALWLSVYEELSA